MMPLTLSTNSHALSYARRTPALKDLCFVTVSRKLSQELKKRFEEAERIAQVKLCKVSFFVFRDLLEKLLQMHRIDNVKMTSLYSFKEYVHNKKSHKKLLVEASLIENEIGGVILGSLTAALRRSPLSRELYLEEKRSNVPNNTEAGLRTRNLIYDEFERYKAVKAESRKDDVNDVVLQLIELTYSCDSTLAEVFQSGTLSLLHILMFGRFMCKSSHKSNTLAQLTSTRFKTFLTRLCFSFVVSPESLKDIGLSLEVCA